MKLFKKKHIIELPEPIRTNFCRDTLTFVIWKSFGKYHGYVDEFRRLDTYGRKSIDDVKEALLRRLING